MAERSEFRIGPERYHQSFRSLVKLKSKINFRQDRNLGPESIPRALGISRLRKARSLIPASMKRVLG